MKIEEDSEVETQVESGGTSISSTVQDSTGNSQKSEEEAYSTTPNEKASDEEQREKEDVEAGEEIEGPKRVKKKRQRQIRILSITLPISIVVLVLIITIPFVLNLKDVAAPPGIGCTTRMNNMKVDCTNVRVINRKPTFSSEEYDKVRETKEECKMFSRLNGGEWKEGFDPFGDTNIDGHYDIEFRYTCKGIESNATSPLSLTIDPTLPDLILDKEARVWIPVEVSFNGTQAKVPPVTLRDKNGEYGEVEVDSVDPHPQWLHELLVDNERVSFVVTQSGDYVLSVVSERGNTNSQSYHVSPTEIEVGSDGILSTPDDLVVVSEELLGGQRGDTLILGDSVEDVLPGALGDTEVKEIRVGEGNKDFKSIDGVLFSMDEKELVVFPPKKGDSYTIPSSVTRIREGAFAGTKTLQSIALHSNIEEIEEGAFEGSGVGSFSLPSTSLQCFVLSTGELVGDRFNIYAEDFRGGDSITIAVTPDASAIFPSMEPGTGERFMAFMREDDEWGEASFSLQKANGSYRKSFGLQYRDGEAVIPMSPLDGVELRIEVVLSFLDFVFVQGRETALHHRIDGDYEVVLFDGEKEVDVRSEEGADYCTLDGTGERITFKKPGEFRFKVTSPSENVVEDAFSVLLEDCYEGRDVLIIPDSIEIIDSSALVGCTSPRILVIPDTVKEITRDAPASIPSLEAIVVEGENPIKPEDCDFGMEPDGRYKHVHTFHIHLYPQLGFALPYTLFWNEQPIPILLYPQSGVGEIDIVNADTQESLKKLETQRTTYKLEEVGLEAGSYLIGGAEKIRIEVVGWDESETGHGIGENGVLNVPYGVYSIGTEQYYYNENIKSAAIPQTVKEISSWCFYASSLSSIIIEGGARVINSDAFEHTKLGEITIPGSVDSIGSYTYGYCSNLVKVTLGEGLVEIGDNAFWNTKLSTIRIPSTVTKIGVNPFQGISTLTSITSGGEIFEVVDNALIDTRDGKLISYACGGEGAGIYRVPDYVKIIGLCAYYGCTSLEEVILNDALEIIEDNAFYKTSLTSISIPGSVKKIGINAFSSCIELKSVQLNEGLVEIGDYAFELSGLSSINIPSTVTIIGSNPFCNTPALTEVTSNNENFPVLEGIELVNAKEEKLVSLFCGVAGSEKYEVSSSIKVIGASACYGCTNLQSVVFHGGMEDILDQAFAYCSSLSSVTIPNGIRTISGSPIFYDVAGLTHLTLPPSLWDGGNISDYAFSGSSISALCFDTTGTNRDCTELAKGTYFWGRDGIKASCGECSVEA